MRQPYKVNLFNALIFIGCGLGGFFGRYLAYADFQPTALIPAVLGLLLLVMTPGMRSENSTIIRVVVTLTLVFGIFVISMLLSEIAAETTSVRKVIIFTIIALSSIISFGFYLAGFFAARKEN